MKLITSLLYRCLSDAQRNALLSGVPHYQRRNMERVLKGQGRYQRCFDRSRSIFIHVPKAAGRSVVRGLYDVRSVEHASVQWYQEIDPVKFHDYFSFSFVRNPWDRLVSAYTYLCQGGAHTNEEDSRWGDFLCSFGDFDSFVCQWLTTENAMRHLLFTPQHYFLCDRLGELKLDFIGRFERLEEDYRHVAEKIPGAADLPHLNHSRSTPYQYYYSKNSRDLVAQVYAQDIELFDYRFPGLD